MISHFISGRQISSINFFTFSLTLSDDNQQFMQKQSLSLGTPNKCQDLPTMTLIWHLRDVAKDHDKSHLLCSNGVGYCDQTPFSILMIPYIKL